MSNNDNRPKNIGEEGVTHRTGADGAIYRLTTSEEISETIRFNLPSVPDLTPLQLDDIINEGCEIRKEMDKRAHSMREFNAFSISEKVWVVWGIDPSHEDHDILSGIYSTKEKAQKRADEENEANQQKDGKWHYGHWFRYVVKEEDLDP